MCCCVEFTNSPDGSSAASRMQKSLCWSAQPIIRSIWLIPLSPTSYELGINAKTSSFLSPLRNSWCPSNALQNRRSRIKARKHHNIHLYILWFRNYWVMGEQVGIVGFLLNLAYGIDQGLLFESEQLCPHWTKGVDNSPCFPLRTWYNLTLSLCWCQNLDLPVTQEAGAAFCDSFSIRYR